MNNNTNAETLVKEIQKSLPNDSLLFRPEAAHIVEIPTPLTYSFLSGLFSFQGSLGQAYKALDLPISEFKKEEYVHYIMGRIYLDLRCEETFLHKAMGMEYSLVDGAPYLQKSKGIASFIKVIKNVLTNSYVVTQTGMHIALAQEVLEKLKSIQSTPLSESKAELLIALRKELNSFYSEYSSIFRLAYIEALLTNGITKDGLAQLSSVQNSDDQFVASTQIWDSTAVTADEVISKFGNRSFNDFELSAPRWNEDTQVLESLLNKRATKTSQVATHTDAKTIRNIEQLQKIIVIKDNLRFYILNRVNVIRQIVMKLGDALKIGSDIFYLSLEDIENESQINISKKASDQKARYETEKTMYAPELLTKDSSIIASVSTETDFVTSTPVSVGKVSGLLSVINSTTDTPANGTILVLPTAGPEFTHLYHFAIGIIFTSGGVLSHGSIISREMHIPAVVAHLPLEKMDTGKVIELDATNGKITF